LVILCFARKRFNFLLDDFSILFSFLTTFEILR